MNMIHWRINGLMQSNEQASLRGTMRGRRVGRVVGGNVPTTMSSLVDGCVALIARGVALCLIGILVVGDVGAQTISTVAGNGTYGFAGDGGAATGAALRNPYGVAVDSSGNIYVGDADNSRIRKITRATGFITTVAGSGTGSLGDGGPATSATLSLPRGIAFDSAGNIYLADALGNRIRKITVATGVITTVAGIGTAGFTGDGGPATSARLTSPQAVAVDSAGNIYVADGGNSRIRKVSAAGVITTVAGTATPGFTGDGGAATSASVNFPTGVAVDSAGNVYVADSGNNRIRKITVATGVISTVAGNGTAAFAGDGGPATSANLDLPWGVAVDTAGNVYVADTNNQRIRKITVATGFITTLAGNGTNTFAGDGGLSTSASLYSPRGVAVDSAGNVYVADKDNNRIRKITALPGAIYTVAGNGTAGFAGDGSAAVNANLSSPAGVIVDSVGNFYVADLVNHRIRKITAAGVITTVAGNGLAGFSGDGAAATSASLNGPRGIDFDSAGNIYVADSLNHRIRKITVATGVISTVAGNGTPGFAGDGGAATSANLNAPFGVAVDSAGNIFAADTSNQRIRMITVATGAITTVAGTGTAGFSGDGGPATSANLRDPRGVAIDNSDNIYVADYTNNRVRKITVATGVITTAAGNGTGSFAGDGGPATSAALANPRGVAFDSVGNMYVADLTNDRIRKVTLATGVITTVAGDGTSGFAGDFGAATSASLSGPFGVAVDSASNVYVADTANQRIRRVNSPLPGAPTVVTATAGIAQASITFTPPGSDGGSVITGYTVTSSPGNVTAPGASSPIVVTGLSNGMTYTFSVAATNAFGTGAASSASNSVTLATTPGAPTIGTATAGNTKASVAFIAPGSNGGSVVTAYTVTSSPGGFTGTGTTSPITVTGLSNGTAYTFTVTATNTVGTGAVSAASNIVTPTTTAPDAPTIGTTTAGNAQAMVTFTAPGGDGGSTILDYTATCGTQSATNATSPITVTGLTNGVGISCTVTARNAIGASAASSTSNSVTPTAGVIASVAGNGTFGFGGDGGAATSAFLGNPYGVAVDSAGNIYVADYLNHRIRKVAVATGVITTVAGTGTLGAAGDGALATSANLAYPSSVAVDNAGNIYVADYGNHRIRKITVATGVITTIAGNGSAGFAGDGGPAASATLNYPNGVAADSAGNIYVADEDNQRIRKITAATGIITTVAGNGTYGFGGDGGAATSALLGNPEGVAVDSAGNIYVADYDNHRIRKITVATGVITTVAGNGTAGFAGDGGPATSANLSNPNDVAVDAAGDIYVSDFGNRRIRRITVATGVVTTVAGNGATGFSGDGGGATSASFSSPYGVAVDGAGNIYVADRSNQRIRKISVAVPGAPTIGTATPGNTQATINFTAPGSDGGSAILSYAATSSPSNVTGTCTAPCTSITVTGLTNGTAYTFVVTAINSVGPGAASASSASVTPMAPAATLTLNAVLSRKSHGGPAPFDLPIDRAQPLTGPVSVEPRQAIGGQHSIVFQFSGPVTAAGTASTTVGNATPTFAGNEVIVMLTNVPDNQRLTITLTNVNGTTNAPPVSMGFLVGDVDNTRSVNSADSTKVRARSGQIADATNFWFDLNATGSINAADVSAVKARNGLVLP